MGLAEFSAIIHDRRRELGLTQEEVASRVGVHANYIGYLERGLRRPGDKTLVALCEALDLDRARLFATLNPIFRDVVRCPEDVPEEDEGINPALKALLDDKQLLKEIGMSTEEARRLRFLSVFGDVERKEDYVRIAKTLQDIRN